MKSLYFKEKMRRFDLRIRKSRNILRLPETTNFLGIVAIKALNLFNMQKAHQSFIADTMKKHDFSLSDKFSINIILWVVKTNSRVV